MKVLTKNFWGTKVRYLQLLSLSFYFSVFMYMLNGDRLGLHVVTILTFGVLSEIFIKYYFFKKIEFPLSGLITALACIMLMKTRMVLWPYLVAIMIAQGSKVLFSDEHGHYFNPANIGLFFVLLLFPGHAILSSSQWLVDINIYMVMTLLGVMVSFFNKKIVLSLSYLITILAARALFAYLNNFNPLFFIGSVINSATLIFSFHMITDPRTSPSSRWGQVLFGVFIALLDFEFRNLKYPFAPILALCIVCATLNPLRGRFKFLRS